MSRRNLTGNVVAGIFQKFDLGYAANFRLYRKKKPPIYEVKKISAPVALIYGNNDIIATKTVIMKTNALLYYN